MTEQTFFAAYGPPVSAANRTKQAAAPSPAPIQGNRQRIEPAIEAQYIDGSWYRVDTAHAPAERVPAPHRAPQPTRETTARASAPQQPSRQPAARQPAPPTRTSVEPTTLDVFGGWANSCVVMATPVQFDEIVERQMVADAPISIPDEMEDAEAFYEECADEHVPAESTPSVVAKVPARPWTALWEVDEFVWTDDLMKLQDSQAEYFRYAGEKLFEASREGLRTLAVVSTREREGCTTMAVCLAQAAAAAGARVALVDGNLDHPELGPKLGLDFSHGWQEALNGSNNLPEAAVLALDTGLTLLPLSATHRLTCLSEPRISQTLRELAEAFDLLIIDAGIAPAGDAEMFERGDDCPINAALIVRDMRRTSETETLVTASRLKSLGIDAIGIAENFVPRQSARSAAA